MPYIATSDNYHYFVSEDPGLAANAAGVNSIPVPVSNSSIENSTLFDFIMLDEDSSYQSVIEEYRS